MLLICTEQVKLLQRSRQHLVSGKWLSGESTCCTSKKIHVRIPRILVKAELMDSTSNWCKCYPMDKKSLEDATEMRRLCCWLGLKICSHKCLLTRQPCGRQRLWNWRQRSEQAKESYHPPASPVEKARSWFFFGAARGTIALVNFSFPTYTNFLVILFFLVSVV